jgi:hypothetical protein
MVDTTSNPLGSSATNPYGLTPSQTAWMTALGGLGKGVDAALTPNSANYMRQAPASFNPGNQTSAGQLLDQLLQMRSAQTARIADPYQQGVGMPQMSGFTPAMSLLR